MATPETQRAPKDVARRPEEGAQRRKAWMARRRILQLLAVVLATLTGCLVVPAGFVAPSWGLAASLFTMAAGIWAGLALTYRQRAVVRLSGWMVVAAVTVKLCVGLWYWNRYMYALGDGTPRTEMATSEIIGERAADTAVVDALLRLFADHGVRYYGEADTYLPINRRVPAHVVAVVVRAFGGRYETYFPFVVMATTLASLGVVAMLSVKQGRVETLSALSLLVTWWPLGMDVCNVTKDALLLSATGLCVALISVSEAGGLRDVYGLALACLVLPGFRPAYLLVAGLVVIRWVWKGSKNSLSRVLGGAVLVGAIAAVGIGVGFLEDSERYRGAAQNESAILNLPIVGRLLFAAVTPFPWTQVWEVWWKYPWIVHCAMQVLIFTMVIAILKEGLWKRPQAISVDGGVLLGLLMTFGGVMSPIIQPAYVSIGFIGLLPLLVGVKVSTVKTSMRLATAALVAGNVLWLSIR